MSDCKHDWETEYDQVRYCSKCEEYEDNLLHAEIAELKRQLAESKKLKQGYYNEAAEGWKKYRERTTVTDKEIHQKWDDIVPTLGHSVSNRLAFILGYRAALEAGDD